MLTAVCHWCCSCRYIINIFVGEIVIIIIIIVVIALSNNIHHYDQAKCSKNPSKIFKILIISDREAEKW